MLIPITNLHTKCVIGILAQAIFVVERDPVNPLITKLVTTMNSAKGLLTYEIMETPEEVIDLVAQAAGKTVPVLNVMPAAFSKQS